MFEQPAPTMVSEGEGEQLIKKTRLTVHVTDHRLVIRASLRLVHCIITLPDFFQGGYGTLLGSFSEDRDTCLNEL